MGWQRRAEGSEGAIRGEGESLNMCCWKVTGEEDRGEPQEVEGREV